jgi:hypothetical protein
MADELFERHEVKPGERYRIPGNQWTYTVLAVAVVGWRNLEIAWCKIENGRDIDTSTSQPLTDEPLFHPDNRLPD